jgi:hypothetical protein
MNDFVPRLQTIFRPEKRSMRAILASAAVLFSTMFVGAAPATDCSVSKEFQVKHPQSLSGILQDPNDVPLPGIELELLTRRKVIQRLRTNNQGAYDFGTVAVGRYRIQVRYGDNNFCAPKVICENQGCRLDHKLTLNPAKEVLVR